MKTTFTMTKEETIKYINTIFNILDNAKDMISMISGGKKENDGKFGIEAIKTEIKNCTDIFESGKNGGCGNEYYRMDVSFKNDEVTYEFSMNDDLIIDLINVYAKAIKSCGMYVMAFVISHLDELTKLMEVINATVESATFQDLAVMGAKYGLDKIGETCYGIFHIDVEDTKEEKTSCEGSINVTDTIDENKKLKEENENLKAKNKMLIGKISMEMHNINFDSLQEKITAAAESLEEAEESEERDSTEISDVDDMSKTLDGWTRI